MRGVNAEGYNPGLERSLHNWFVLANVSHLGELVDLFGPKRFMYVPALANCLLSENRSGRCMQMDFGCQPQIGLFHCGRLFIQVDTGFSSRIT